MRTLGTTKLAGLVLMVMTFFCSTNMIAQKVVKMRGTDQMKFTVTKITAKPGQKITIELTNDSKLPAAAMSHNFVLLKKSADAKAFCMAGARHKDNEYIDPSKASEVIAKTALAAGGHTVKVTFTAPKSAGNYTYVCTFPGHYISGMHGTLVVQ